MRVALFVLCSIFVRLTFAEMNNQRHQGYSGFSEFSLAVGNTASTHHNTLLNQSNSIVYTDIDQQLEAWAQFSVEADHNNSVSSQFHQLYFKRTLRTTKITVGRFDQIDNNGYYTIDGLSIKPLKSQAWRIFMGVPRRLDGDQQSDGGWVLGGEKHFKKNDQITGLRTRSIVGLSQHWSHGDSESYLSLRSILSKPSKKHSLKRLDLSGVIRLDDLSIETLVAKAEIDVYEQARLYLSYDHYQPSSSDMSFHDRFFQSYSQQSQNVLRADWSQRLSDQASMNIQARRVWHENTNNGYGLVLGVQYEPKHKRWKSEVRSDYIQLDDQYSATIYTRYKRPINSVLLLELQGMLQQKKTQLTDEDFSQGIALSLNKMLAKDLYLGSYVEFIDHSDREDEYLLRVALKRHFYQLPWEKR